MSKNGMVLDFGQFLLAASRALDAVEHAVLGAAQNHCKRVTWLCVHMAKQFGLSPEERMDLSSYAALHDNALTEYITVQRRKGLLRPGEIQDDYKFHCEAGEQNIAYFPFLCPRQSVIRYHHENFDGSGLYGIKGESIPLMARMLRLADSVDVQFGLRTYRPALCGEIVRHLQEHSGSLYDPALIAPFSALMTADSLEALCDAHIDASLARELPRFQRTVSYEELLGASEVFARIIDYKSPFTLNHSRGIADKARRMAEYYDFEADRYNELRIAALLHDVGKLATPDALLEKPGKLTPEEFEIVKRHVFITHEILGVVDGFERIEPWASSHHERLDGGGYFRGSRGDEQDFCSRLLACIDVYQALVEDRPYRRGMDADRAMEILQLNVRAGKLDGGIVRDLRRVLPDIGEENALCVLDCAGVRGAGAECEAPGGEPPWLRV